MRLAEPLFGVSRLALLLLLCVLTAGCVANRMYRHESIQRGRHYSLAFIEFDDQGEMWRPDQLARAAELIHEANQAQQGALIVVYVHGWQHNASTKDETRESGNVHGFKDLLWTVAASQRLEAGDAARPVIGVYLGWRGKSGVIPGLNALTFYGRARAARRIAGTSATEVIYRLSVTGKSNPRSRIAFIGHSFGGQILERALSQTLVSSVIAAEDLGGIPDLMDLVVLINPAVQSIYAKQLIDFLDRNHIALYRTDTEGNRYERPLIVSVTSAGDLATRWAFPGALYVRSAFTNMRRYDDDDSCMLYKSQRTFYARTPGHNPALLSHRVRSVPLSTGSEIGPEDSSGVGYAAELDPVTRQPVFSFYGESHRFTIRRDPRALNDTPYWIMRVPTTLIPNHSGFFTPDTLRLLRAIFGLTGAFADESGTALVRENRVRPVALAVLPSGRTAFADASRRTYTLKGDSPAPEFLGCLPQFAKPGFNIGLETEGDRGIIIDNRPESVADTSEYQTALLELELTATGPELLGLRRVRGERRFSDATYDFEADQLYLTPGRGGEIFRADLSRKKAVPELWHRVGDAEALSTLLFDQVGRRLYVATGKGGSVYRLRPEAPVAERVSEDLGWVTALGIDSEREHLFALDADGGRIWRIRCPTEDACKPAEVFATLEGAALPSLLAVEPAGGLWVGDPEARAIFHVSAEGELLQTISELPGS